MANFTDFSASNVSCNYVRVPRPSTKDMSETKLTYMWIKCWKLMSQICVLLKYLLYKSGIFRS